MFLRLTYVYFMDVFCNGCSNSDPLQFVLDDHRNTVICTLCACDYDPSHDSVNKLFLPSRNENRQETMDIAAQLQAAIDRVANKPYKGGYRRRVFITERLLQSLRKEPRICEDHMDIIKSHHTLLHKKNMFYSYACKKNSISKKQVVRSLLRSIDEYFDKKTRERVERYILEPKEKSTFCKQYLEKWATIAETVLEVKMPVYSDVEYAAVGVILEHFSNRWDYWQPMSREKRNIEDSKERAAWKERWKFKDRKHFPYINHAVRYVHKLLGLTKYDYLFPLPKSKLTIKKNKKYLDAICRELNIVPPEINVK